MKKKHCLFCDDIVPIVEDGDYDRYKGCACSPEGSYALLRDSYGSINAITHQKKRDMFPLISAYIRERTDDEEKVALSADDLEEIANSPEIPMTLDEKGGRLLKYLYRHTDGPGQQVVIQPLSSSYNLTYSPNLQELVYIIEKLKDEELLIREGMSFSLTQQGWSAAAARAGGRKPKPGCILISGDEKEHAGWADLVLPKAGQYGYLLRLLNHGQAAADDSYPLELIADSKLIIADLTEQSPSVYLAAGYALGQQIPVIWTVKSSYADRLHLPIKDIRPLVWENAEELTLLLQQKLSLEPS